MRTNTRSREGRCRANYGFHFGATNRNIEEIKALQVGEAAGIKAFMGASTGDMLVDDPEALELLFEHAPMIILTHCEHSPTIRDNEAKAKAEFGEDVPMSEHPNIRSANACLLSSSQAVDLARRHDSLLHVLHLTTAIEMGLFSKGHRSEKRITAEVCVHHLWFDESRYKDLGTRIKCNPAIKTATDREALIRAVNEDRIDVIATDHAPHTKAEKGKTYFKAPAGLPLVQHVMLCLFDMAQDGQIDYERIVDKTAHAPADIFGVVDRGYVREGYFRGPGTDGPGQADDRAAGQSLRQVSLVAVRGTHVPVDRRHDHRQRHDRLSGRRIDRRNCGRAPRM